MEPLATGKHGCWRSVLIQAGNGQVNGHNQGLPNAQKSYLTQKVLESWKRTLGKPNTCLFCSSASPSASALGHCDRTVGQALLWPNLVCPACTLAGPCFSWALCRGPQHPAPGLTVVSELLCSHPPPLWWSYSGCSSCVYFQIRPTEWFINSSIHFILLLLPYFQDKSTGNSWGAAGIPPPLKVCCRCLSSWNEPGWKGDAMGSPACTAAGDQAPSSLTDDRSEI